MILFIFSFLLEFLIPSVFFLRYFYFIYLYRRLLGWCGDGRLGYTPQPLLKYPYPVFLSSTAVSSRWLTTLLKCASSKCIRVAYKSLTQLARASIAGTTFSSGNGGAMSSASDYRMRVSIAVYIPSTDIYIYIWVFHLIFIYSPMYRRLFIIYYMHNASKYKSYHSAPFLS